MTRTLRVVRDDERPEPRSTAVMGDDGTVVVDGVVVGRITHDAVRAELLRRRNDQVSAPGGRYRAPIVTVSNGNTPPVVTPSPPAKRASATPPPAGTVTRRDLSAPSHTQAAAWVLFTTLLLSGACATAATTVAYLRWVLS